MKLGILGTASIAESIVTGASKTDLVDIVAIAGRNYGKTTEFAAKAGIPNVFMGYDKLLASGMVDAVYIPLPNTLHLPWVIKALNAGLPVLCEKPIGINADEAKAIQDASIKSGLPVMEAMMYINHPLYRRLFSIINSGEIGRIKSIESVFTWYCDDAGSISANAELGGGGLLDVGCYCTDVSRQILGTEPIRVSAFETRNDVDENLIAMMEFPGDVLARFECGISSYEQQRLQIKGERGIIIIEQPWLQDNKETEFIMYSCIDENIKKKVITVNAADTYQLELELFDHLVSGVKNHIPLLDNSVNNMKVIDALFKSASSGCAVRL